MDLVHAVALLQVVVSVLLLVLLIRYEDDFKRAAADKEARSRRKK